MNELVKSQNIAGEIVSVVRDLPVFTKDDINFLQENAQHLTNVLERTHMWRTDEQKLHIINDIHFPTAHAKLHQAMLEQKVQFDQAMYLAKDFEVKKLEIEELECDLQDLLKEEANTECSKRNDIKRRKIEMEIAFKKYELKNMQIAMSYRMAEVKGWQKIQDKLLKQLREAGVPEDVIWSKNEGEFTSMFFIAMNNLSVIEGVTDSAEKSNIIALATHMVNRAKEFGALERLKSMATAVQLKSIEAVLEYQSRKA